MEKKLVELGLAVPCPYCNGEKMVTRFDIVTGQPRKVHCDRCYRKGVLLSDAGKLLGELLKIADYHVY